MKYGMKQTIRHTTMASRKFAKRYLKPTAFDPQGSLFEGLVWTLPSSKGDKTYNITLDPKGFECDCTGFAFHGRCKHSQQILKQVEEAVNGEVPEYKWV